MGKFFNSLRHEGWVYGLCETCLRNSHEKNKMIKEKISNDKEVMDVWVCTVCGATKKL